MSNPASASRSISPLWLVPIALSLALPAGLMLGRGPVFLVLGGCAVLGVVWVFWQSIQSLTGEAPLTLDEALSLGAPAAEEERKLAVLRALKDLEYERSVGKLDEQDFQELSQKYRAEAKVLLQLVDESLGPARARALAELEQRLQTESAATPATLDNKKEEPSA